MPLTHKTGEELSTEKLADLITAIHTKAPGRKVTHDSASFTKWVADSGVSLPASYAFYDDDEDQPVGGAFVSDASGDPKTSKLADFGFVPDSRGKGLEAEAIEVIAKAEQARGKATLEMEVHEDQKPTIKMLEKEGFEAGEARAKHVTLTKSI